MKLLRIRVHGYECFTYGTERHIRKEKGTVCIGRFQLLCRHVVDLKSTLRRPQERTDRTHEARIQGFELRRVVYLDNDGIVE